MAVDALIEASTFAETLAVPDVSFFAGTKIGSGCVEAGGVDMAVVLTKSALIHVGTLSISPMPGFRNVRNLCVLRRR